MRPQAFVMMPHCWSTNRNFLVFTQSNDTRVNLSSFDSTKAIFTMCKKHSFSFAPQQAEGLKAGEPVDIKYQSRPADYPLAEASTSDQ